MKAIARGGRFDGREFEAKERQKYQSFWRFEDTPSNAEEHVYVKTDEKDEGRVVFERWDDDKHGLLQVARRKR